MTLTFSKALDAQKYNAYMKFMKGYMFTSILLLLLQIGCQSEYEQTVARELASGEQHDEIFLGLELGMSSKDFYEACWKLNRQQVLVAGSKNLTAEYTLEDLNQPAKLNFYPDFHEGKVYQMPFEIEYKVFAPWVEKYSDKRLLEEVKQLMEEWYGSKFFQMEHPEKGIAYVKVDGNRRVMFYPYQHKIKGLITDLQVEQQM